MDKPGNMKQSELDLLKKKTLEQFLEGVILASLKTTSCCNDPIVRAEMTGFTRGLMLASEVARKGVAEFVDESQAEMDKSGDGPTTPQELAKTLEEAHSDSQKASLADDFPSFTMIGGKKMKGEA